MPEAEFPWRELPGPIPSALSPDRLRNRRAEVPAALDRSGPTASQRHFGAQCPQAVMVSLEKQTPVRAALHPPVLACLLHLTTPSKPLDLTQAFCPSVSLLLLVVKRKPWTSLSSESVSCPQGSLSPAASLVQVSQWVGLSFPHSKFRYFLGELCIETGNGHLLDRWTPLQILSLQALAIRIAPVREDHLP